MKEKYTIPTANVFSMGEGLWINLVLIAVGLHILSRFASGEGESFFTIMKQWDYPFILFVLLIFLVFSSINFIYMILAKEWKKINTTILIAFSIVAFYVLVIFHLHYFERILVGDLLNYSNVLALTFVVYWWIKIVWRFATHTVAGINTNISRKATVPTALIGSALVYISLGNDTVFENLFIFFAIVVYVVGDIVFDRLLTTSELDMRAKINREKGEGYSDDGIIRATKTPEKKYDIRM